MPKVHPFHHSLPMMQVEAVYSPSTIPDYRGNKLIEALPPLQPSAVWTKTYAQYPRYDESERQLPAEVRLHSVLRLQHVFVLLTCHVELKERLDIILRRAYVGANASPAESARKAQIWYERVQSGAPPDEWAETAQSGECLVVLGGSGVGKSRAIRRYLSQIPTKIIHSSEQILQVPVLYVQCPHNGSTKDFAEEILRALDRILGTSLWETYWRRKEEQIIAIAAGYLQLHHVGMLVIDEIQCLSNRKSGGRVEFVDFFLKLYNTLDLSIVVIGTMKAARVLQTAFRQTRRVSSLGSLVWDRFGPDDKDWKRLLAALWKYQWLREPTPMTDDIERAIYDETQGVTSLLVRLLILVQMRAIRLKDHPITPELIHQVARDNFTLLQPMICALRSGNPARIAKFEDFDIPGFENFPEFGLTGERSLMRETESDESAEVTRIEESSKAMRLLIELGIPESAAKWHLEKTVGDTANLNCRQIVSEVLKRLDGPTGSVKPKKSQQSGHEKPSIPSTYEAMKEQGWISPTAGQPVDDAS